LKRKTKFIEIKVDGKPVSVYETICDHCKKNKAQRLSWSIPGYENLCISCRDELAYTEEEKKKRLHDCPGKMEILPYLEWGGQGHKNAPRNLGG
jgi:hypothetical protein